MIGGNLPLKSASFIIALLLAYGVHSSSNVSVVSLFVPIEIKNAPEDRVLVKPVKRGAQVTLKGPSFMIGPVASAPPPIQVKLPDNQEDRVTVSLKASDISLPTSVEVVGIEPAQVEFVFEALEKRELKVEVPRIGQLPGGLVLEGIEVSPKVVGVKGPRGEIKQMRVVESEPINLSEIRESTEVVANLRVANSAVSFSTRSVLLRVNVGQVPSLKEFSSLPVEIRVPRGLGRFAVAPSQVSIKLSGAPEALAAMKADDVVPFVRISDLPRDRASKVRVMVDVPDAIRVLGVEPAEVSIEISETERGRPEIVRKGKANK